MSVIEERLTALDTLTLGSGSHRDLEHGACVMEAVAYVAGEPWTDHPACASPVITAFLLNWNDSLRSNDERDRLIKPLVPLVVGTRTTKADETRRAWMATDWLVREQAPAWLRLAGLTEHAHALENLSALKGRASAVKAQPALEAARSDAAAAGAAAAAAAWDAAWDVLEPTVTILQPSAALLVKRMCEVGRK